MASHSQVWVSRAPTLPNPPTGLAATATQGTIELTWVDNSSNETGFSIERNDGPTFSGFVEIDTTGINVTAFTDTSLTQGVTYRYRVRAFNASGNSAYTSTVEISTTPGSSPLSLSDYGTLQDEKDAYALWGWSYTAPQLPSIATGIRTITSIDVHNSLEADDLWQNIVMYNRTGGLGYHDLAESWASYYKDHYESDWTPVDLAGFFGDHTFGWGLLDWAILAGDNGHIAAAESIGDTLETAWAGFSTSTKNGFNGMRGPGRILKLAVKLGRRSWADQIWAALRDSFQWSERTIGGVAMGFWKELDASTITGVFSWATGATGFISPFEFAVLNEGLSDYYELTNNQEVARRLVLMARWAQYFGLDPYTDHTGHFQIVDFPTTNAFFHTGVGAQGTSLAELLDPFYTTTLVNVLTRGYILSGDADLLLQAKEHWSRASRAIAEDTYPYTNRISDSQVGHFMNGLPLIGNIFYTSDGELPYVGLLFKAALSGPPQPPPPDPTTLSVTPLSVGAGGTVTVTWANISSPSSVDWIGLYTQNQGDVGSLKWVYVSGSQIATTAFAAGSIQFVLPSNLSGVYEFRLFRGNSYIRLASSQLVSVSGAGITFSASPSTLQQGNEFTITWSGISNPKATDWVGLYTTTGPDSPSLGYVYINSGTQTPGGSGSASGSIEFPICASPCANRDGMADDIATGTYEFRLFEGDSYNRYATSNSFTVTAAAAVVPADPSNLVASVLTSTQVSLAWSDNSNNETSFSIERCSGSGCTGFAEIATTAANVTSYADTGRSPSTIYRYKVRAHNITGYSGYTSIATATTPQAGSQSDSWTVLPNSSLRTKLTSSPASSYIASPGPDGVSHPMDNIILSWSGGVIFTRSNGEIWLIIKNGGHDSWFYNDVWGYHYNAPTPGWFNLKQSYTPYINYYEWDVDVNTGVAAAQGRDPYTGQLGFTAAHSVYPDGSPGNAHTYDRCFYSPLTDEVIYPTGAHGVGGPRQCPINHFSMATHSWSYGPSWFGMGLTHHIATSDVRPDGKVVIDSGIMVLYDPVTKTVSSLNTTTSENVFYQTGRYLNGKMYNLGPFSNADPRHSEGSFVHVHEVGVSGDQVMTITGGPIVGGAAPGFVWEPALSRFVIWGGGANVQLLNPATGAVTTRVVPGSNPGDALHYTGGVSTGIYKRFDRIGPGQYICMNSIDEVHLLTLEL